MMVNLLLDKTEKFAFRAKGLTLYPRGSELWAKGLTLYPPEDRDDFSVRLRLENHSLTPRRYKINMAVGQKDYGAAVRHFDCLNSGLLKFEVKYIKQGSNVEYSFWNKAWGPVMHQGCNVEATVV